MRREAWLVVAAGALAVAFASVHAEPMRIGPSSACVDAVVVQGELRCDDEAALSLRAACGEEHDAIAGDVVGAPCSVRTRMSGDDLERLGVAIDVNSASLEDLASLRGVGPVVAQRIVDGRPYASVEELDRVKGIGPKTLVTMRPRVVLHPPMIKSSR